LAVAATEARKQDEYDVVRVQLQPAALFPSDGILL
jgi:hypothetical protein